MADINATDLTPETLSTLDGQENVVLFDTAEGKKVSLQVLADYVVQKATESLMGSNQTVAAAFTALNSNAFLYWTPDNSIPSDSDLDSYMTPGCYYVASGAIAGTISHIPNVSGGRLDIQSVQFVSKTSSDGAKRLMQTYTCGNANILIYKRYWNGSSWGSWKKISVENVS